MDELFKFLDDLGYMGPVTDIKQFEIALNEGAKNVHFTDMIAWLSQELQVLCNLESCVNSIHDVEDSSTFLLELSSFLKDLECPYESLMEGPVSQRLVSKENRELLFQYLCTELEASRIMHAKKPESTDMTVEVQESALAKQMKNMLIAMNFSKPPPNITVIQLFEKVETKLKTMITASTLFVDEPLFSGGKLTEKQWCTLEKLKAEMHEDYTARRHMLIIRSDVTIQSFSWSDRLKGLTEKIAAIYHPRRKALTFEPSVDISDLLAAREDLTIVEKTSSASVRKNTKSSVNAVIIGAVPDRGGRPDEQPPPPPEIPSWQKNEPPKSGFSDTRSGGGGFSSGRSDRDNRPQNDNRNAGGFNNPRNDRDNRPRGNRFSSHNDRSANSGDRGYQNRMPNAAHQNAPVSYIPMAIPHHVNYFPAAAVPGQDFGIGFGGYSATGGNFQQYGAASLPSEDYQSYVRPRRGPRGMTRGRGGGAGDGPYVGGYGFRRGVGGQHRGY